KLQMAGGKARPGMQVGTSLSKFGINLGQFATQFNERARQFNGIPIPVIVTVYSDRSSEFKCKSPPASALLKIKAGIAKGSGVPNKEKVGKVTRAHLAEIVKEKWDDLNARDPEHAISMIAGTARSMGITVEG